jgi:ABC-type phosphate transport system permease subunit
VSRRFLTIFTQGNGRGLLNAIEGTVVIAVRTLVLAVPLGVRRSRVCRAVPERNLGEEDPVFLRYHRRVPSIVLGYAGYVKFSLNSTMLAWEAQEVMSLRIAKLARGGPDASEETHLMIMEKVSAFGEAAISVATGGSAESILSAYRDKVSANRHRLS